MNVLIIGATGTLGKALTKELLASTNDHLTLFARHVDQLTPQSRVQIIAGDARNPTTLGQALRNQDVVYCAISGNHLPQVAENLVTVMPKMNVQRLIFTAAVGIYNEIPDAMDGKDNLKNNQAQLPNRRATDIITASSLNYTIVRPGFLRSGDSNDFVLTTRGEPARGYITTIPSLVKFASQLISNDKMYSRGNVSITKNDTVPTS